MKIAVLLPCFNEELTVKSVINDFKKELPQADIYVYDNNSTDNTYIIAKECGVHIKKETKQGKGNVVRSMFKDINADIYILVDADDTYPAQFIHKLMKPIIDKEADMVIGDRLSNGTYKAENTRALHNFGNNLVKNLINKLFNTSLKDIMTGYRVFNKAFVKNIAVHSNGFEIETEMTLHSLDKKFTIQEIPIDYKDRPEGSFSKLNTISDGFRVLKTIGWVFKDYKPLYFFSFVAFIFFILGLVFGIPVIIGFIDTGLVSKMPSAILATGCMLIFVFSLFSGFILDTIVKQHNDTYQISLKHWINNNP